MGSSLSSSRCWWPCLSTAAIVAFVLTVGGVSAAVAQENPGPNANLARWASGKHVFRTVDDHRLRGEEYFRLSVHPDGTRTMMIWKDLYAVNSHIHAVMRVAENFRPLEAFANYWQRDGYKGSVRIVIDGDQLRAMGQSPAGPGEHVLKVPEALSVVTHGEGLNSWGMWPALNARRDQLVTAYNVSPERGAVAPVLGSIFERTVSYLGEETIAVPAGTFATERASNGMFEVWVTKQDRILVRQLIRDRGLEFVLVELATGPTPP